MDIDIFLDNVQNLDMTTLRGQEESSDIHRNLMPSYYEFSLLDKALEALSQTTGLVAHVTGRQASDHDGFLVVRSAEGHTYELPYEVKPTIDRYDHLLTFKARHNSSLLITRSLSNTMAAQCRETGIQFIDETGNCFLHQPGLYVYVSAGRKTAKEKPAATRGLTPAVLRLALAVLTRPEILNNSVRKMAEVASISHGAVGGALVMLEEMGFLSTSTSGRRMALAPQRWLDAWTEGFLGRIRPKLEMIRMSSAIPVADLIDRVNPRMREVALGGEAAAAYRNLGLKPGTLSLYVDFQDTKVLKELVQELRLRRDPQGSVELVSMFWNTNELPCFPTVPDALIYADLIGLGDARTMEIAEKLRKEICSNVENKS